MATVGYGNYYPVTAVGRIIAVVMMLSGIGTFILLDPKRIPRYRARHWIVERSLDDY